MNINGLSQTDWVHFLTPKLNFLYRAAFISPLGRKKSQFSNFKDLCSLLLKIFKTWQNTLQDTHKSYDSSTRNCVHHLHKEQVAHAGSVPSEKFILKILNTCRLARTTMLRPYLQGLGIQRPKMCEKNTTYWHSISSVNSVCNRKEN